MYGSKPYFKIKCIKLHIVQKLNIFEMHKLLIK